MLFYFTEYFVTYSNILLCYYSLQWKALIEERRAKQSADKQKEIEEQQRNFMEQTLAEKKEVSTVMRIFALPFFTCIARLLVVIINYYVGASIAHKIICC